MMASITTFLERVLCINGLWKLERPLFHPLSLLVIVAHSLPLYLICRRASIDQVGAAAAARHWSRAPSLSGSNRWHLWLLFSVLGAPLAPVHVSYGEPPPHLSIKVTPIEASSADHILHQYTVASGGQKVGSSVHNAYAMGKLKMLAYNIEIPNKVTNNMASGAGAEWK